MPGDEIRELVASIVSVEVEAMNDVGDTHYALGTARVDQAVREAVQEEIRDLTRDESYDMNEWGGLSSQGLCHRGLLG